MAHLISDATPPRVSSPRYSPFGCLKASRASCNFHSLFERIASMSVCMPRLRPLLGRDDEDAVRVSIDPDGEAIWLPPPPLPPLLYPSNPVRETVRTRCIAGESKAPDASVPSLTPPPGT